MQEGEIELLKQPFSGLMYVGDIAGLMSSKKMSVPCISQSSVRPLSMMISQPFQDLTFDKNKQPLYSRDCFVCKPSFVGSRFKYHILWYGFTISFLGYLYHKSKTRNPSVLAACLDHSNEITLVRLPIVLDRFHDLIPVYRLNSLAECVGMKQVVIL
jgi:hypothetical protein